MVHRHSTIIEAYSTLGLEQGSPLELVKSTYRQLALRTHPDKNPGNEDATAQFQRLSEAYNVLLKHLDGSNNSYDNYDDEDDYEYGDYGYDDTYEEDSDYEEHLEFYMFLFEELLRGRASRHSNMRYRDQHPKPPPETPQQYQARFHRMREEQEQAEARRAREEASRKAATEKAREREKKEAEERQRMKAFNKKAQAAASQKSAEQKARAQREHLQALRSEIFTAARRGDPEKVKKGVWEDNVDAAGGEVRKGSEDFLQSLPEDKSETLMHIAAKNGDADLIEWLDTHGAEAGERDSNGFTAFHVALQRGHIDVIKYFFTTYHPHDADHDEVYARPQSKSLLRLAVDSSAPEAVWMILDKELATEEERSDAWRYTMSDAGKTATFGPPSRQDPGKHDEIRNLLKTFGGFEVVEEKQAYTDRSENIIDSTVTPADSPSCTPSLPHEPRSRDSSSGHNVREIDSERPPRFHRGQRYFRRPYKQHHQPRSHEPSSNVEQSTSKPVDSRVPADGMRPDHPFDGRGRGRRRGRGRGRGGVRGRGRGQPPA